MTTYELTDLTPGQLVAIRTRCYTAAFERLDDHTLNITLDEPEEVDWLIEFCEDHNIPARIV
jgi:hypothetical protein